MADPRAQPGLQLPQHPLVLKDAARRDQGTAHHVCIRSRDAVFTYQSKVLERQGTGLSAIGARAIHKKATILTYPIGRHRVQQLQGFAKCGSGASSLTQLPKSCITREQRAV